MCLRGGELQQMSLSKRGKKLVIGANVLITAVLSFSLGLSFPVRDLILSCVLVMGLSAISRYYRRRGYESFVTTSTALMHLTAYSMSFTTAMYGVAAIGRPLIDETCMAIDASFGVSLPAIVEWAQQHPRVSQWLMWAYATMAPQTAFVIALLGLTNRTQELRRFLWQFMIASMIVMLVFAVFPAVGPFRAYGYSPAPDQVSYLAHFDALRSGERTLMTWREAEGLITFPSFHTAWAVLLTFAVRWNRWVFGPVLLLNLAVIASTMTTGWHYFADVLGGTVTAFVAIGLCAAFDVRPISDSAFFSAMWRTRLACRGAGFQPAREVASALRSRIEFN